MEMDGRLYDLSIPEAEWVSLANDSLPTCLTALGAEIAEASRSERAIIMKFTPGPSAMHFGWVSGGAIAEMLV